MGRCPATFNLTILQPSRFDATCNEIAVSDRAVKNMGRLVRSPAFRLHSANHGGRPCTQMAWMLCLQLGL